MCAEAAAAGTNAPESAPGSRTAGDASRAETVAEGGSPLSLPGVQGAREQAAARRPSTSGALGDVQTAVLYAEAEHIMDFLQVLALLLLLGSARIIVATPLHCPS
jgi:hypothetical protein